MSCVSLGPSAGLALVLLAVAPLSAAPAGPQTKTESSPAEKLRKDLNQVISIDIIDQPLNLALNQLRDQTKINFVLDQQTLAQMGIGFETPVNGKFKDARVRSILRTILGGLNLNYAIVGEIVFVSTDEMTMYRQMQQRVSVDLDKVDLTQALRQLSRETATNLILDPRAAKEASQPVSIQAEDVPLETVVRLMAEMVGLKPVRVGNVLFVCGKAQAQELRNDPDLVNRTPGMTPGVAVDPNAVPGPGGIAPRPGPPGPVPPAPAVEEKPADPPPPPPAKPEREK